MKTLRIVLLICVASLACATEARAAGWSLWPTSGDDKPAPAKPAKAEPSLWSRASAGTKSFFRNMGDALSFKKSKTVSRFPSWSQTTPAENASRKKRSRSSDSSEGGWFSNMFGADDPQPPRTPQEFLALPRPGDSD